MLNEKYIKAEWFLRGAIVMMALVVLASVGFAAQEVKITADKDVYTCHLGTCEIMNLEIKKMKTITEPIDVVISQSDGVGEIIEIRTFQKKSKSVYEKKNVEIVDKINYALQWKALGSGKFDIVVKGTNTGTEYGRLDPWFSSDFLYRTQINISGAFSGAPYQPIVLNSSVLNYSRIDSMSYALTRDDGGTETRVYVWEAPAGYFAWNESGNSFIFFNSTNGTHYLYYGNTSPVGSDYFNGSKVFYLYDDFDAGTAPDTSKWTNYGADYANISGGLLYVNDSGTSAYDGVYSKTQFNATSVAIVRFNTSKSATAGVNTAVGFGIANLA
ncbi:MAG: DUF2341 domain-containing protein, partial [Candidatus Aenigmatarchaeota archaeon]